MRVICAIGVRGGADLVNSVVETLAPPVDLVILHVIDTGPRRGLESLMREPRRPGRSLAMDEAEASASQAAVDESLQAARAAGLAAQSRVERGNPEQVIVAQARQERCDLIVIHASEGAQGRPQIGPASVGHTARFVLDHAPCNVLLLRQR